MSTAAESNQKREGRESRNGTVQWASLWRRCATAATALMLSLPLQLMADEPPSGKEHTSGISTRLLVGLPGASAVAVRYEKRSLKHAGPKAARLKVEYASSDVLGTLEQARLWMNPARLAASRILQGGCPSPPDSFVELSSRIGNATDHSALETAGQLLRDARNVLACGGNPLEAAALSKLLLLEATFRLEAAQDPADALDEALAISPSLPFPEEGSQALQEAFRQAQRRIGHIKPVTVRLDRTGLGELQVIVDGVPVSSDTLQLTVGRHFLQLITPDQQAISGRELVLTGPDDAIRAENALLELVPPTRQEFLVQLQRQIKAGALSPDMTRMLQEVLQTRMLTDLTLVAQESEGRVPVLTLTNEGSVQAHMLSLEQNPIPDRLRQAALGAGTVAAGASLFYGVSWYRIKTETFEDTEAGLAVLTRNRASGAVLATCTIGALMAWGTAQYWPVLQVARRDEWMVFGAPVLMVMPDTVLLQWGGIW